MKRRILLATLFLVAFAVRIYGLNWDQNQHLHPDERFLTMVATAAQIPLSFADYLNPAVSTLNPYNLNFPFYVYGTLPVTLVKLTAVTLGMNTYDGITLVGRATSALFDVGTLVLIFLIGREWMRRFHLHKGFPYAAVFLYGIAVLPIQLSHFFTVDSFGTFFCWAAIACGIFFERKKSALLVLMSGVFFGLAVACKISAVYVAPIILYYFVKTKVSWRYRGIYMLIGVASAYVAMRLGDPRIFQTGSFLNITPNESFLKNLAELKNLTSRTATFPPAVQWMTKKPIVFPLVNMIVFGFGIVPFLLFIRGMHRKLAPMIVWLILLFLYLGIQPVMTMRYFYVLYPGMALLAGVGVMWLWKKSKPATLAVLIACTVWPLSFLHIYTQPHSRVTASEWMYEHISGGSKILIEHWDDGLPLSLAPGRISQNYVLEELAVFDQDSPEKESMIHQKMRDADYYVLSSNRGYGSMGSNPQRYPFMSRFYADLFAGKTSYKKVAEFTSFPTFLGIQFDDQWAEEAFTVYDHPRVVIFARSGQE